MGVEQPAGVSAEAEACETEATEVRSEVFKVEEWLKVFELEERLEVFELEARPLEEAEGLEVEAWTVSEGLFD